MPWDNSRPWTKYDFPVFDISSQIQMPLRSWLPRMINNVDPDCRWHSFLVAPSWHARKQQWGSMRPRGPRPKAKFLCSCSALQGKKQNGLSQSSYCTKPAWHKCAIGEEGGSQTCYCPGPACIPMDKTIQISLQLVREVLMSSGPMKNNQFRKC